MEVHKRDAVRDAKVVSMSKEGKSFREIGEHLGISRQRAHQIYVRWHNLQLRQNRT